MLIYDQSSPETPLYKETINGLLVQSPYEVLPECRKNICLEYAVTSFKIATPIIRVMKTVIFSLLLFVLHAEKTCKCQVLGMTIIYLYF